MYRKALMSVAAAAAMFAGAVTIQTAAAQAQTEYVCTCKGFNSGGRSSPHCGAGFVGGNNGQQRTVTADSLRMFLEFAGEMQLTSGQKTVVHSQYSGWECRRK